MTGDFFPYQGFYVTNPQLADTAHTQHMHALNTITLNNGGLNIGGSSGAMMSPEYTALMTEINHLRVLLGNAPAASPGPVLLPKPRDDVFNFKATERMLMMRVDPSVIFGFDNKEPHPDGVTLMSTAHPNSKWEEHGPVPFDGTLMFEEFDDAEAKDLAHEAIMKTEGESLARAIGRMQQVANGQPIVFIPEF